MRISRLLGRGMIWPRVSQQMGTSTETGKTRWVENVFLCSASLLLIAAGLAKLWTAIEAKSPLSVLDPVFQVNKQFVQVAVALIELGVASFLLTPRPQIERQLLLFWLSTSFILYRAALWWVQGDSQCPCFAGLDQSLSRRYTVMRDVPNTIATYLCLGSLYFLIFPRAIRAISALGWKEKFIFKLVVIVSGTLFVIPPLQVIFVGLTRYPVPMPMVLRSIGTSLTDKPVMPNLFIWCNLDAVPVAFQKSVLAAEDQRFFEHGGFDFQHIRLAILEARATGRRPRGASTISQQCARSLFLWQGRSWIRKGLEAYYTLWMELLLSKKRILQLYVNVIELGDGIYGVEAAARHYYNKSARDLTREEAAMLAAILPAPKRWNPLQPTEQVRRWQETILARMDKVQLPWEEVSESNQVRAAAPAADARVEKTEQKSDAAPASSGSPESVR